MNLKSTALLSLIILSTLTSQLYASNNDHPFELRPFYGYRFGGDFENYLTGDKIRLKSAPAYGLALDYSINGGPEKIQLLWSHQDTDLRVSDGVSFNDSYDITVDYFGIGGLIEYPQGPWAPYVSMTVGATHLRAKDIGSDTRLSFSLGGGVKYFPGQQDRLALHADVRGYATVVDSRAGFIFTGGESIVGYNADVWGQLEASIGVLFRF